MRKASALAIVFTAMFQTSVSQANTDQDSSKTTVKSEEILRLTRSAEAGEPDAMWKLYLIFQFEESVRDVKTADLWLQKAIKAGHGAANGVFAHQLNQQNPARACFHFEVAAWQGDVESQLRLGACYAGGIEGFEKNYGKSTYWFSKAAAGGESLAINFMSSNYEFGRGVSKNLVVSNFLNDLYIRKLKAEIADSSQDEIDKSLSKTMLVVAVERQAKLGRALSADEKMAIENAIACVNKEGAIKDVAAVLEVGYLNFNCRDIRP